MKKVILIMQLGMFITFVQAQTKTEVKATPKRTEIKSSDLMKDITAYISMDYAGYKILKAYKVDTKKVITYEVTVMKDNEKYVLYFDSEGKFDKKVAKTTTPVTHKAPTTPVKKTTVTKAKVDSTK
jgi:hypothetical protein